MKKIILIMLITSVTSVFTACQSTSAANPIMLPDREDIISIGVTDGDRKSTRLNSSHT